MNITIRSKLVILICLLLLIISCFFIGNMMLIQRAVLAQEEANVNEKVEELIKNNLKGQLDTISLSIEDFYQQSLVDNIKAELAEEISSLKSAIERMYENDLTDEPEMLIYTFLNEYRWQGGRYLFAYDAETLANEASGTDKVAMGNSYNAQDEKGNYYARDIVNAAKQHEIGYSSYFFSNPKTGLVEEKLSVSFLFKPMNLVIGTGEYISTLRQDKIRASLHAIGSAKYGKHGFFWVQDKQGKILVHGDKDLVGQKTGTSKAVVDGLKNHGETFIRFAEQQGASAGVDNSGNKIIYAREILPEWGWTIATQTYESDITQIQSSLTDATKEIFNEKVYHSITVAVVFLVISLFICVYLLNIIITEMKVLRSSIDNLSSGEADLTIRLDTRSKDELGDISRAVNQFIIYLQSIMLELSESSKHITQEINQLHDQTERNAQALASHRQETELAVTAISQMSATAQTVAHSAAKSASVTQDASSEAKVSRKKVDNASSSVLALVNEMEGASHNINIMSDNTQQIEGVLEVIGSIAEQTNLLALNAAIEAARAGEQGRGFAVVADEVRTLASRTQASTAEIETILKTLSSDASQAVNVMAQTQNTCQQVAHNTEDVTTSLDAMSESIQYINELGSQIASASDEQSRVAEEVNRNMHTIESMAQALSTNGQQTITSADRLTNTNQQLAQLVKKFKLV